MMTPRLALAASLFLLLTGCNKDKDKDKGKGSPCPEGSYTNAAHKFCLKPPAGATFEKEEDRPNWRSFHFKDSNGMYLSVQVPKDAAATYTSQKAFIEGSAANAAASGKTVVASGKPEGAAEGAFVAIRFKDSTGHQLNYVIKDGTQVLECYANVGEKHIQAAIAACKTLRNLTP